MDSLMKNPYSKKIAFCKIALKKSHSNKNIIEKTDSKNILWKTLFYDENISEKDFWILKKKIQKKLN